jgi:enoyl-CoA hydratase/carnithine racemase
MSASEKRLELTVENGVATIWIRNERRRNAMTASMWAEFSSFITEANTDSEATAIVVRGFGDDFSAGADISDLRSITGEQDANGDSAPERAEAAISSSPKPTIAAIDGFCIGGGWEIAAACDIRVATRDAKIGITPAKMGIVYPLSAIRRLVAIAGPATAKDLLLTGRTLTAEAALGFGMITQLVDPGALTDHIAALTGRLASLSQLSIQATKNIVDGIVEGSDVDFRDSVWRSEVESSGEREIGVRAFLEKQTPAFAWTGEKFWADHPNLTVGG